MAYCNCESSLCPHHDVDAGQSCSNPADPDVRVDYIGSCCRRCADAMAATGGGEYVHYAPIAPTPKRASTFEWLNK